MKVIKQALILLALSIRSDSKVKTIVESFLGSGILVTQAKVNLQKSGLAGQSLKIKDQYECLVKLIEKMESAKYAIKEAVQAIQQLDFVRRHL